MEGLIFGILRYFEIILSEVSVLFDKMFNIIFKSSKYRKHILV